MPRKTKKEMLMTRQDPAAPYLFDEDQLPVRNDLVQVIREERYKTTGARLLENEALALKVVEKLMCGWGLKRIARELHISTHSIRAARTVLVQSGKLAPYKTRVLEIFEEIVERGASNYLQALENNEVPPAQIPVGIGIISDKRALALGEPTVIGVGPSAVDPSALTPEKLNAWLDNLKQVTTIDTASTVNEQKGQQNEGI